MDSTLKIQWMPATPPAWLEGPFRIETKKLFASAHLHGGVIVIKCSYAAGRKGGEHHRSSGWGCLRVDNVPLMQMEELAQNFLVLAEARYGNT